VSRSLARAAPVRFLIGVAVAWTTGRGVALVGWAPPTLPPLDKVDEAVASPPLLAARAAALPIRESDTMPALLRARLARADLVAGRRDGAAPPGAPAGRAPPLMLASLDAGADRTYPRSSGLPEAAAVVAPPPGKRWSGSAWAFLRGGGRATTLSPGQVGGGQAGARILYRIDGGLSAAARISTAIGGARQTEAAFGLDWKPIAKVPVHLMAERRVAIDRGGRNAWTLGAAGGVDDVRIAPGWRLDGYGEAGVVGARRRDLYADGAARIARAIDIGSGRSLAVGGGAWGAAQPGATRLDIGPSVVLRMPVEHHAVAVALDWRERVLGAAKPGSGVALTVATDF
jgi:hypothetical protein